MFSAGEISVTSSNSKFAGGEATLNFPLIWELHRYAQVQASAHELALEAVVLSNGVGLGRAGVGGNREHGAGYRGLCRNRPGAAGDYQRKGEEEGP